jgi:hypothetical protein
MRTETRELIFRGADEDRGPERRVSAAIAIEQGPDEESPADTTWYYVTLNTPGLPIALTEHTAADGKLALTVETYVGDAVHGEYIWCDVTIDIDPVAAVQKHPATQVEAAGGNASETVVVQVFSYCPRDYLGERIDAAYDRAQDARMDRFVAEAEGYR